jgi:D-alanyl-D-alanine carboxypeptidase
VGVGKLAAVWVNVALVVTGAACGSSRPEPVQEPAASPTVIEGPALADDAADATTTVAPVVTTAPPVAVAAPAPGWVLGAKPLPKGPDGKPLVLPTPEPLRDRRLPTVDRLPPPPAGAPYQSTAAPIDATTAARMGTTWQPGCPVPLSDLRHLTLSFWGFDGRPHTGELVVHAKVADDVRSVFGKLFAARFPLEEMRIVEPADLAAEPTGDGNTTAAFVCRPVRGSTTTFSAHSFGLAVDVNPFQNPYKKGDSVLPELASAYLDRSWARPGMIKKGDVVTKAFASVGWTWGGSWTTTKDTMHFSENGR